MTRIYNLAITSILSTALLSACGESLNSPNVKNEDGRVHAIEEIGNSQQKIALVDATSAQLSQHISVCRGQQICVKICHRPPGQPENSKEMILPLKASLAHLNHGGTHTEKDFLGACDTEAGGGTDTDTEEDPNQDEETGTEPEPELPLWCEENFAVDSDCDGLDDNTDTPIY